MFEFDPSGMAVVAQWLQQYGMAFGLGMLFGILSTSVIVAHKLIQLRREGVLL